VLFLDEVTELTLDAQAKCLRVLQEHEFVRLGGTRPIRSNVRVVAATNRDLRDAVTGGKFRSDLYFRLNVFNIHIPPLRQRCDDIIPLAARELRNVLQRASIVCEDGVIRGGDLSLLSASMASNRKERGVMTQTQSNGLCWSDACRRRFQHLRRSNDF